MTAERRFWSKVKKGQPNECWEWTASIGSRGYGRFTMKKDGKTEQHAHRVSYILCHGSIPIGLYVLHNCDNKKCINPSHLFTGTQQINVDDMIRKGRNCRGSRVRCSKLKECDVVAIRKDGRKQTEIAASYGVTQGTIWQIKERLKWKHIKD